MEILTGLLWSVAGFAGGWYAGRDARRVHDENQRSNR